MPPTPIFSVVSPLRCLRHAAAVAAVTVLVGCETMLISAPPSAGATFPSGGSEPGLRRTAQLLEGIQVSGQCLSEGSSIGSWYVRYTGFGCVGVGDDRDAVLLTLRPQSAQAPEDTHAALAVGPTLPARYTLSADVRTISQLRVNSPPNAWEAAWLVWSYLDDAHFYYFIPKANGWELGKRDPAYPGGQRFLATGDWSSVAPGAWQSIQVAAGPGSMRVSVGGTPLVDFFDEERPYTSGRLAMYSEDAEVQIRNVTLLW